MQITLKEIIVRDLYNGFTNNDEEGIIGYNGLLNIRPKYQREFIYKDKQREAVINTVRKDYPLNSMYWIRSEDGLYEVLDGQQRTLSICTYIAGDYSINHQYFHNLEQSEKDQILDYKLFIYVCEGAAREKLDWFTTINTAGEPLTAQELRNSVYTGPWLEDAKKYFSKTKCPAFSIANNYVKGVPIRQEYLETALEWTVYHQKAASVEDYMAKNQNEPNCNELWLYFQSVTNWVKVLFPKYDSSMKGLNWGMFYSLYKDNKYDPKTLQSEIDKLMGDDDITKKSGIFEYILSNKTKEKVLSIRAFTDTQKRTAYAKQKAICPLCTKMAGKMEEMEADHITPWSKGGKTISENLQMICKSCNRTKSSK